MILVGIEIILLSAVINFVAAGSYNNDPKGHILAIFIIAIAAAESAIGLSIFSYLYKKQGDIGVDLANLSKD